LPAASRELKTLATEDPFAAGAGALPAGDAGGETDGAQTGEAAGGAGQDILGVGRKRKQCAMKTVIFLGLTLSLTLSLT
jgi:hypothetical protein